MRKICRLILCFSPLSSAAQEVTDLELGVRRSLTDMATIESFLNHAVPCYQHGGRTRYRNEFCRHNKDHLFSFESLNSDLAALKEENFEKWKGYLEGQRPPAYARPILAAVNSAYETCKAHLQEQGQEDEGNEEEVDWSSEEGEWIEEGEGGPLDAKLGESEAPASTILNAFLPVGPSGDPSLDPQLFNQQMMAIEGAALMLEDPESRQQIDRYREEAMRIRLRLYERNPLILNYAALSVQAMEGTSEDVFWREFQELTGMDPRRVPEEVRTNVRDVLHFRAIRGELTREGYAQGHPQTDEGSPFGFLNEEKTFELFRNERGELEARESQPPAEPEVRPLTEELLLERLGWPSEKLAAVQQMATRYSSALDQANPDTARVRELMEAEQAPITALAQIRRQLSERLKTEMSSGQPESEYMEEYPEGPVGDNYCENDRLVALRNISDQDYLINFYENPDNKKFMHDNFEMARTIMSETIDSFNLSADSKTRMKDHLNALVFSYPNLSTQTWGQMFEDAEKGAQALMARDSENSARDKTSSLWEAMSYLRTEPQYVAYTQLEQYDGVNAFYLNQELSHAHGGGQHHVTATCGIALPNVQQDYPEFFMGIMAHEMGHALDPGISSTTRRSYSSHSMETVDDLRRCLIQGNRGLFNRVTEDFADHLEAHFRAQWARRSQNNPRWPIRRQRFLHFAYSAMCDDAGGSMTPHSDNDYRSRHVISHPDIYREFGELAPPRVEFCPQLLPSRGDQR